MSTSRRTRTRAFIAGWGSLLDLWPVVNYEGVDSYNADSCNAGKRGQLFGAAVVFAALAGSMTALYMGHESFATILACSAVISPVAAFALGRKSE